MAKKTFPVFQTAFDIYKGMELIGNGGTGWVYRAENEAGEPFAVKLLDPAQARGDRLRRFKNEIFFCRNNQCKNILTVLDDGLYAEGEKKSPFYVMPLFDSSLRPLLRAGINSEKVLPYFGQILDGVEAAHFLNVVHRDLKPENILFDKHKDTLVIADFGIARFQEENIFTAVETKNEDRLANFLYAAPEQRVRGAEVGIPSDMFALGLILNELFTGQVPHGTGYKLISSASPAHSYLDGIVDRMLKQDPAARPQSVELIKNELIARGNEFIARQRLSELRHTVIPISELDDPLLQDPIHIVGVDYDKGILTLILNRSVNPKWVWALRNMGDYSFLMGKEPGAFQFSGKQAKIHAQEEDVQKLIDCFKGWLPRTHQVYEQALKKEKREEENALKARLQANIEEEERRARVLKNVRF